MASATQQPASPSQPVFSPGIPQSQYSGTPSGLTAQYAEQALRKQINRTENGLLLLAVGLILGPIPYVGTLGGLLILIGAILVILGRRAFGEKHSKYTIWSLIIYIAASIIIGGIVATAVLSIFLGSTSSGASTSTLISQFEQFFIVGIIAGIVTGIANVFFTYALQRPIGRYLLWLGYTSSIIVSVTIYLLISPLIADAVLKSVLSGSYNPSSIEALQRQQQFYGILQLIPAAFYATACYMARDRIVKREIPDATVPPPQSYPSAPSTVG